MSRYPSEEADVRRVASVGSGQASTVSDPIEIVIHLLAAILDSRSAALSTHGSGPQPMLTVEQTAALLGTSRTTIIRKAEAGELPCVVVSRGRRKKMRRFPHALIVNLAVRAGGNSQTDLGQYAAGWLASIADQSKQPPTDLT